MAESHNDDMHNPGFLDKLQKQAKKMLEEGSNVITAGKFGEQVLFEYEKDGVLIRQMPDDPLALRVSIGQINITSKDSYLVFRGDPKQVKLLLTRMLNIFREQFPVQGKHCMGGPIPPPIPSKPEQ